MGDLTVGEELIRREVIGSTALAIAESSGGYLTWEQLSDLALIDGTSQRLIDPGRGGIWNPKSFLATLSIITSPAFTRSAKAPARRSTRPMSSGTTRETAGPAAGAPTRLPSADHARLRRGVQRLPVAAPQLLDAAHIIEDGHSHGDAVVPNGLSLCKIHHAAFDRQLLGITPGYEVRINSRLLDEVDGPMLRHGLQEMHGVALHLPRREQDRPDRDRLSIRYTAFATA